MRIATPVLVTGGLLLGGLYAACVASPRPQDKPASAPEAKPAAQAPATTPAATPAPSAPAAGQGQGGGNPMIAELQKQIAGKEDQPAEKVFMNIQNFKGVPAGRVLRAMDAFTHALGVKCSFCHDPQRWESDDKHEKQAARGMMRMTGEINEKYLKGMPGVDEDARVTCTTCHRGQPHPGGEMPPGMHH